MTRLRYKFFVLALLVCAHPAFAQVRPPARDTLKTPADTTRPAQDTTPAGPPVFADSVRPIPQLVRAYLGTAHGFSDAVWVWDRNAILTEAPITLGDLLERIPGVIVAQAGLFAQPQFASSMGGSGNRLEVWLDGYVLDPLLEGSFDLARMELAEIDNVRVERRLGTIRVYIETIGAQDTRAYSMVEAAVGQPNANLFRGVFLSPKIIFGPAGLAIDRLDTRGLSGEPANQLGGWAKWAFIRHGSGVQVEYRRATTNRDPQIAWPESYTRTDVVLRARAQILPNLMAEAFAGRSRAELDTTAANVDSIPHIVEENNQFGGRFSFESPFFWANGSFRARDAKALAKSQIDAAAGVHYTIFSAVAQTTQTDWRDAGTASELTLRGELAPLPAIRIFGEKTSSDRGVPYLNRMPDSAAVITPYSGYRAGAEITWRRLTVGGAYLKVKNDSTTTFGLPFDTTRRVFPGSDVTGVEVSGRMPLPLIKGLVAEGNLTNWSTGTFGLYMPTRIYRGGLELHAIPLKSGNLEVLGRIEAIHRGPMFAVNRAATSDADVMLTLPALDYIDGYLQIRIMDVRAFVRYYDVTGEKVLFLPDRSIGGPRIMYGVKWQFFN